MDKPEIGAEATGGELNKSDIIELFEQPDEQEVLELDKPKEEVEEELEEDKEGKEEEEEGEEKTLEEELEEELKPPTEEQLELMTPVRRKEILTKYPTLFKDFPYLERAYFRDREFTEVYPTIEDAREAKSKADTLDDLENSIMNKGDIGAIFQNVKSESVESFHRVVDNLLPALEAADKDAYYHVLGNVIKSTIMSMATEGKNMGDNGQPLLAAANILNQYVFGSQNFTAPGKLSKEANPEEKSRETELAAREQQMITERFESARDDLQTRVDNTLRATIDVNIDPTGRMSDYLRKNAVRDAFDNLEKMIANDKGFRTVLDKLWERSYQSKFNKDSLDRIRSAYLSKAKTLLPTVIKQARAEALKGLGKRTQSEQGAKPQIPAGRSTSHNSGKKPTEVPRGMKTVDFFLQD